MDGHHPRFREGIEALRLHQTALPPHIATASSSSVPLQQHVNGAALLVLPLPPRPAAVQRALTLLTVAEADELDRLSLRYEANRQKLLSLQKKQSAAPAEGVHVPPVGESVPREWGEAGSSGRSVAMLRHDAATRRHSELLTSVWTLFSLQLRDRRITEYRDVGHLHDAMSLVGVRPT
jgi:hypothetical protein